MVRTTQDEADSHIVLSPVMAALLFGGSFLGGGGAGSWIGPRLDEQAVMACFDNSKIAIGVAEQHGDELLALRRLIEERTTDRHTGADQREHERKQERTDAHQDRRLDYVERRIGVYDGAVRAQSVPENE